jgi:hypothetical protein
MSTPTLPKLLVPQTEAQEKIKARIIRGQAIVGPLAAASYAFGFGADEAFRKVTAEREKWAKFTIALLRTLFSDLPIGTEFGSADAYFSPGGEGPNSYWSGWPHGFIAWNL